MVKITINDVVKVSNGVIQDTDVADASIALAVRSWFITFITRYPSVTKLELENV